MSNAKEKLVLIHGWGLNSAIWQPLVNQLKPKLDCICIDMPGYGSNEDIDSPTDINGLAEALLKEAPQKAHWCAWSLGGMAAIVAAKRQPDRIKSLSLLCTTARFTQTLDWEIGMDINIFKKFANELKSDYQSGIQKFLLLQAGAGKQTRSLAMEAAELLKKYPAPSHKTLSNGLNILEHTDLREQLSSIPLPCQVISGRRDRIVNPEAGKLLSQSIPASQHHMLNSGHAPLLSCPNELANLIIEQSINA